MEKKVNSIKLESLYEEISVIPSSEMEKIKLSYIDNEKKFSMEIKSISLGGVLRLENIKLGIKSVIVITLISCFFSYLIS